MPDSRTLWTAVVIICIAVSVFFSVKKRTTFKRLQQLMAAKQWDEFDILTPFQSHSPYSCTFP